MDSKEFLNGGVLNDRDHCIGNGFLGQEIRAENLAEGALTWIKASLVHCNVRRSSPIGIEYAWKYYAGDQKFTSITPNISSSLAITSMS